MKQEYEKQAEEFLEKTNTKFKVKFIEYGLHFTDDKDKRDIYEITLTRGKREYSFKFGQSIASSGFKLINTNTKKEVKYKWQDEIIEKVNRLDRNNNELALKRRFRQLVCNKIGSLGCKKIESPEEPTAYDVLACLQKYEVGTFKEFCDNFGYNEDSRSAERTYKAVVEEYNNLKMLYSDKELDLMGEIQ